MTNDYSDLVKKISEKSQSDNLLVKILALLKENFGLTPIIGAEIEFYTNSKINLNSTDLTITKETGDDQYEINLAPLTDPLKLIQQINKTKIELSQKFLDVSFEPIKENCKYGNAMHFHLNFITSNGNEYFAQQDNLLNTAASLCHYMQETFLVFAPNENALNRFINGEMTPSKISFGLNNRTTAIRVPPQNPKRIEHRLANPQTCPYLSLFIILKSVYLGLQNPTKIKPIEITYGNAFDEQYQLQKLTKTISLVKKDFNTSFFSL